MVSSALVSTDGGPILRSSGVLPSNLSHSVDRSTLNAFEAAFLDMRPSRTSFSADSILVLQILPCHRNLEFSRVKEIIFTF